MSRYGDVGTALRIINLILVIVSIVVAITTLVVAVKMKNHTKRMGWFITTLCMVMGGLMSQIASEKAGLQLNFGTLKAYTVRSYIYYAMVAPLFSLYFIETEREEGQKWDGAFWSTIQGLSAVLVFIFVLFGSGDFLICSAFMAQFVILTVMLMISAKDIKDTFGFIIGIAFPFAATLFGIAGTGINAIGFGMVMFLLIVFFGYQMDTENALLKQQVELSDSRLSVLMDQIHPHFIYNSLQQIALLCDEEPSSVKPAILNFSGYLRKNFESLTDTGMIPFEQEMEHVDMFVALADILPSRCFEFVKNFEVEDFYIPALTVQPLVENAIKYGIGMSTAGETVTMETKEEGGYIYIIVRDNGHGNVTELSTQKKHKSVGTQNVKTRLKALCDGEYTINKGEFGTEAVIKIPAIKAVKPETLKEKI